VNWERQASWHEAEGAKPEPVARRYREFVTVTQDVGREDIVEHLCGELKNAGFTPKIRRDRRQVKCALERMEEQIYFVTRTKPHYMSKQARDWAERYLTYLKTPPTKRGKPRKPFPYTP